MACPGNSDEFSDKPRKPTPEQARRWRFGLLATLIGLIVALWLVEIAFRLMGLGRPAPEIWQSDPKAFMAINDPELVFTFRPGLDSRTWNAPTRINSLGMRAAEIDPVKPANEFRIIMLGDSVTFGLSVGLEQTFTKALERLLNDGATTRTYRVYNAGVPSYNTDQEYRFLSRLVDPVKPDLVILNYTIMNDYETPYRLEPSGFIVPTAVRAEDFAVKVPFERSLGKVSYAWRFIARRIRQSKIAPKAEALVERVFKVYRENLEGWQKSKEALAAIEALLKSRGAGFGLFVYPEPSPTPIFKREDYRFLEIHQRIEAVCKEHGIAYLDLLDDFLAYKNKRALFVAPTDAHPSVKAHNLVARGLLRELKKHGLLPLE